MRQITSEHIKSFFSNRDAHVTVVPIDPGYDAPLKIIVTVTPAGTKECQERFFFKVAKGSNRAELYVEGDSQEHLEFFPSKRYITPNYECWMQRHVDALELVEFDDDLFLVTDHDGTEFSLEDLEISVRLARKDQADVIEYLGGDHATAGHMIQGLIDHIRNLKK